MRKVLGDWLKIYEDEIALFLWVLLLLFLIRTSSILFNNFAETAFLKRFGVEYLPIVQVINSFSTFFIMAFITGLMAKIPGSRMLGYMLLFSGISVAALRFVVPLGFELIYPVLYVLKAQYEALLVLLFWNLSNDLFNTRQSKRLFPLITAGGVVGGIIGSFATPPLARLITMDNLMLAYLVTTVIGAMVVKMMGTRFPALLVKEPTKKKQGKKRMAFVQEFKDILPLMKQSTLVKILILLTLLPNVAIPIINYQFSYAVNDTFATQGGMLDFFGYFRGAMNIVSLIILLFVGRVYGKWGLPIVLMFHPVNYMIAFAAFLFKFDIFSAMYARVSTNVIRTTMNNPARAVLMGLFPVEYRAVIRPFLRGTVVRIGILAGSGIIIVSEGWFHPRYLSIAAMIFVGGWILTTFWLKKSYSNILLDLITRNIIDLKSLEDTDLGSVFADKNIQSRLIQDFVNAKGRDALWYAELLKPQGIPDFDAHLLRVIEQNDHDATRVKLLSLLSPEVGEAAVPVLKNLVDSEKPELTVAAVKAANRLAPEVSKAFSKAVFENQKDPEVKAYAVSGLYRVDPEKYREVIDGWLASEHPAERRAGVIASGESEDPAYIPKLKSLLSRERDDTIIPHILTALRGVKAEDANELVAPYLTHPKEPIRLSALDAFDITDDDTLRSVINCMGDRSESVQRLARKKIEHAGYENPGILVESLNIPRRQVREGIFDLLDTLGIKELDIIKFARSRAEHCYHVVAEIEALKDLPESSERDLLMAHLENKKQVGIETMLRVLATEDRSGRMRAIWRGVFSADQRRRSNGLEALDDLLDASLSKVMLPLIENLSAQETLAVGKKNFKLPNFDKIDILPYLLEQQDWVTQVLVLYYLSKHGLDGVDEANIGRLVNSDTPHVHEMARIVRDTQQIESVTVEEEMEPEISIPDKILRLKGINIFEGLAVSELGAVASVTEVVDYPAGETVIKEGEAGETMYLVIEGEVSVIKERGEASEDEMELAKIGAGDYFGEMALFEDSVRSASIRTDQKSRFLVLHKQEFTEIVREYPQIALSICKALSGRLRELHKKVEGEDS